MTFIGTAEVVFKQYVRHLLLIEFPFTGPFEVDQRRIQVQGMLPPKDFDM